MARRGAVLELILTPMGNTVDVRLEALNLPLATSGQTLPSPVAGPEETRDPNFATAMPVRARGLPNASPNGKTFYIETFGCQMNVHD